MTSLDGVWAALGVPALPGARCRNRGWLFDERGPHETDATATQRHNQALTLCRQCEALDACAAWVDSLPVRKRPFGVIANRIRTRRHRTTEKRTNQ